MAICLPLGNLRHGATKHCNHQTHPDPYCTHYTKAHELCRWCGSGQRIACLALPRILHMHRSAFHIARDTNQASPRICSADFHLAFLSDILLSSPCVPLVEAAYAAACVGLICWFNLKVTHQNVSGINCVFHFYMPVLNRPVLDRFISFAFIYASARPRVP